MYFNRFQIIRDAEGERAAKLLARQLIRRGLTEGEAGIRFTLRVNHALREDSYRITGSESALTLEADTPLNLIAACGRVLRGSEYAANGMEPTDHRGTTVPDCPYRCVYMANHFHNFYQVAPESEMLTYMEELSLWGFNAVHINIPEINLPSRDDPETIEHTERCAAIMKAAKSLGWSVATGVFASQSFTNVPKEIFYTPVYDPLKRHGNCGNIVCISKPEGKKWMDDDNRTYFQRLKALGAPVDVVRAWPYDEGGCGCEQCAPWGRNGYIRASKSAFEIAREYYPNAKRILSTWTFDTPPAGEWQGLADSLEADKWCDVILADAHEDFPRWPLEHGVPGNLPLISFPEISMWSLYPWGGWGATLYPFRLERLWKQTEGVLQGETLYSEGITEDLNKAIVASFCEDWDNDSVTTLKQYARYEFGCQQEDDFVRLARMIETLLTDKNPVLADEAFELAKSIDASLPEWGKTCWRWRLIYLRTLLDTARIRDIDPNDREDCVKAMEEVIEISHCLKDNSASDPYHERVRPILRT